MSKINENEISRRLERLSKIEPTPTVTGRAIQKVRDALIKGRQSPKVRIWRMIWKSPITRIAAAAVIIVVVGFFAVHQGPDEQIDKRGVPHVARSPVEMLTAVSLNIAYRKGGMEAVEEQYNKVSKVVRPRSKRLSVQQLLAEFNGNGENSEGTKLWKQIKAVN